MTTNIQYNTLNINNFYLDFLKTFQFSPNLLIPNIFRKFDKTKYNSYNEAIIRDQELAFKLNNEGIVDILPENDIKDIIYKNKDLIRWTGMNFIQQVSILYNNVYLTNKSFCYPLKIEYIASGKTLIPERLIGVNDWNIQNQIIRECYLGYSSPASDEKLNIQESFEFIKLFYHPEYLLPNTPIKILFETCLSPCPPPIGKECLKEIQPSNCYIPVEFFNRFSDFVLFYRLLFFDVNPDSVIKKVFFNIINITFQVQNYVVNYKQGKTTCFPSQYIPFININTEYNYIQTLLRNDPALINSLRNNYLAINKK
jgi:hypothetical protein